jgi:hypothetical protein
MPNDDRPSVRFPGPLWFKMFVGLSFIAIVVLTSLVPLAAK